MGMMRPKSCGGDVPDGNMATEEAIFGRGNMI